jgi:hypothetical protein
MTISVEGIEKKKGQEEIPPARRGYFTIPEFWRIMSFSAIRSSCWRETPLFPQH